LHYLEQALAAGRALNQWRPGKDLLSNLARNWTAAGDFMRARSYFEQVRDNQALLETENGRRRLMLLTQAMETDHVATYVPSPAPATSFTRSISHLTRIGREITGKLDEESMFVVVYHHLEAMIGARRLLAWSRDGNTDALEHCFSASAVGVPASDGMTENLEAAVKQCVQDRSEVEICSKAPKLDAHEKLYAVVLPMERSGTLLGIVAVQTPNGQPFSEHERFVLRTICEYSTIALGTIQEARKIVDLQNTVRAVEKQLMESEKLAILGQLTAGVAHEINNPANFAYVGVHQLAGELEAFRDFLLTLAGDDVDPDVSAALNNRMDQLASRLTLVAEGATRIKQVAADLGAFARKGRGAPQLATVGNALHSTVNLVKTQYGEDIEFVCTLQADPVIECDISQLNQVFMNLIVNACYAIRQRKAGQASSFHGLLQIDTRIQGKWLVVSFVDNGCGIPASQLGRIFERYYTTKPEGKGTGLGLSISQTIVHKHRGRIEVDSLVGRGTTFTLYLLLP
jgi:signal transduction histidine kinase